MTLYSTNNVTWPVLQSSTEVKHASGVLSASAQFICPANAIQMPAYIPSSAGDITNIYPPPSVSIQGGWATINATGYKKWGDVQETIKGMAQIELHAVGLYDYYPDDNYEPKEMSITIKTLGEAATVKKIGVAATLPITPTLSLFGKETWNVKEIFGMDQSFWKTGNFSNISPTLTTEMTSVRQNNFGNLVEIEASYILKAFIDFGYYSTGQPPEILEIPE